MGVKPGLIQKNRLKMEEMQILFPPLACCFKEKGVYCALFFLPSYCLSPFSLDSISSFPLPYPFFFYGKHLSVKLKKLKSSKNERDGSIKHRSLKSKKD